MKLYSFLYKPFRAILSFLYRIKVAGVENEPENAPFIICPNHISNIDVFLISVCLKHQIRFLAKAELFKIPLIKQFITALGAFPIKRGKGDVGAIKRTLEILNGGEAVGIYPQGTRYPGVDPRTTEPKYGIGLIAYRSKVPVLPICIQTKKYRIIPFRQVNIKIGKPISYDDFNFTTGTRQEFEIASNMVFNKIVSMIED